MKQKMKSALTVMLTLALVSATAVAYTWASTTATEIQDPKNNTFTSGTAAVQLAEPLWNSYSYDDTLTTAAPTTGTPTFTDSSDQQHPNVDPATLGENIAKKYMPNVAIPKDPSLKNNSAAATGGPEWLAMSVDYKITLPAFTYKL